MKTKYLSDSNLSDGKKWVKTSVFWIMFILAIASIFMVGFILGTKYGIELSLNAGKEIFERVHIENVIVNLNTTMITEYMGKLTDRVMAEHRRINATD